MGIDRELLKEALAELVQLRSENFHRSGRVSQSYEVTLARWAERIGVEARKLDKLVLIKEIVPRLRGH